MVVCAAALGSCRFGILVVFWGGFAVFGFGFDVCGWFCGCVFNSVGIITLCYAYCLDFGLGLTLAVVALFGRCAYFAWVVCLVMVLGLLVWFADLGW